MNTKKSAQAYVTPESPKRSIIVSDNDVQKDGGVAWGSGVSWYSKAVNPVNNRCKTNTMKAGSIHGNIAYPDVSSLTSDLVNLQDDSSQDLHCTHQCNQSEHIFKISGTTYKTMCSVHESLKITAFLVALDNEYLPQPDMWDDWIREWSFLDLNAEHRIICAQALMAKMHSVENVYDDFHSVVRVGEHSLVIPHACIETLKIICKNVLHIDSFVIKELRGKAVSAVVDVLREGFIYSLQAIGVGGNKKKKGTKQLSQNMANKVSALEAQLKSLKMTNRETKKLKELASGAKIRRADDSMNLDVTRFRKALTDPFHPGSNGARVCDAYSFPTSCFVIKGTTSIISPSGSTSGTVMMTGHPLLSYIDFSNNSFVGATFTGSTGMARYTSNTAIYGATTPAALTSVLDQWRNVATGIKVRVQMPELNRTGRLMIAPIILSNSWPNYSLLNTQVVDATSAAGQRLVGGNLISVLNSSAILSLPGAFEVSLADLGLKDLLLLPKPNGPNYRTFHTSQSGSTYNSTTISFDSAGGSTTTGAVYSGGSDVSDLLDPSGMTAFLIHFEGVPNTTVPVIDIEYVYHLEGTPSISASGSIQPIPSETIVTKVSTAAYNAVLDKVAQLPWGRMIDVGVSNLGVGAAGVGARLGKAALRAITNF